MADDPSAVGTSDSLQEATRSGDHAQLLSKLDSQDLALAAFDPERSLAVQVAGSADLESVVYDGVASRTGHCRTLPRPDADPEWVSFAVLTCQNYLNGYFAALHHVAEEHRA